MKRLIFCLFVLIGAAAISNIMACSVKKSIPQAQTITLTGKLSLDWYEVCYCWDDYRNECPECPIGDWCQDCGTPAIVVEGHVYFLNDTEEGVLKGQGYKDGDEVEVIGVLYTESCVDFIDVSSMKKMKTAIEDTQAAPASLDLQQPMYNMLGVPVDENYKGVVIQNGTKYVIY